MLTPAYEQIKGIAGYSRVAFVRNPIARFFSMYGKRIARKHPHSNYHWERPRKFGLPVEPDINHRLQESNA